MKYIKKFESFTDQLIFENILFEITNTNEPVEKQGETYVLGDITVSPQELKKNGKTINTTDEQREKVMKHLRSLSKYVHNIGKTPPSSTTMSQVQKSPTPTVPRSLYAF